MVADNVENDPRESLPVTIIITCHYCAYDLPDHKLPKNYRCPKCLCFSWEKLKMSPSALNPSRRTAKKKTVSSSRRKKALKK